MLAQDAYARLTTLPRCAMTALDDAFVKLRSGARPTARLEGHAD